MINEHNDPNLAETPHYKEKQTILPNPISLDGDKKPQTPVKRTHDSKPKKEKKDVSPVVSAESSPKEPCDGPVKTDEAKIDMRKLVLDPKPLKKEPSTTSSSSNSTSSSMHKHSSSHSKKAKHKSKEKSGSSTTTSGGNTGSDHHRSHSSKKSHSSKERRDEKRKSSSSSQHSSSDKRDDAKPKDSHRFPDEASKKPAEDTQPVGPAEQSSIEEKAAQPVAQQPVMCETLSPESPVPEFHTELCVESIEPLMSSFAVQPPLPPDDIPPPPPPPPSPPATPDAESPGTSAELAMRPSSSPPAKIRKIIKEKAVTEDVLGSIMASMDTP